MNVRSLMYITWPHSCSLLLKALKSSRLIQTFVPPRFSDQMNFRGKFQCSNVTFFSAYLLVLFCPTYCLAQSRKMKLGLGDRVEGKCLLTFSVVLRQQLWNSSRFFDLFTCSRTEVPKLLVGSWEPSKYLHGKRKGSDTIARLMPLPVKKVVFFKKAPLFPFCFQKSFLKQ